MRAHKGDSKANKGTLRRRNAARKCQSSTDLTFPRLGLMIRRFFWFREHFIIWMGFNLQFNLTFLFEYALLRCCYISSDYIARVIKPTLCRKRFEAFFIFSLNLCCVIWNVKVQARILLDIDVVKDRRGKINASTSCLSESLWEIAKFILENCSTHQFKIWWELKLLENYETTRSRWRDSEDSCNRTC